MAYTGFGSALRSLEAYPMVHDETGSRSWDAYLQVLGQVVDALGVEKLANNIRRFQLPNRLDVLLHRIIKVSLAVEMCYARSRTRE